MIHLPEFFKHNLVYHYQIWYIWIRRPFFRKLISKIWFCLLFKIPWKAILFNLHLQFWNNYIVWFFSALIFRIYLEKVEGNLNNQHAWPRQEDHWSRWGSIALPCRYHWNETRAYHEAVRLQKILLVSRQQRQLYWMFAGERRWHKSYCHVWPWGNIKISELIRSIFALKINKLNRRKHLSHLLILIHKSKVCHSHTNVKYLCPCWSSTW